MLGGLCALMAVFILALPVPIIVNRSVDTLGTCKSIMEIISRRKLYLKLEIRCLIVWVKKMFVSLEVD